MTDSLNDPGLSRFERDLAQLQPTSATMAWRERLVWQAGYEAGRRNRFAWAWPLATAAACVIAVAAWWPRVTNDPQPIIAERPPTESLEPKEQPASLPPLQSQRFAASLVSVVRNSPLISERNAALEAMLATHLGREDGPQAPQRAAQVSPANPSAGQLRQELLEDMAHGSAL
jgi:hypothetical protein